MGTLPNARSRYLPTGISPEKRRSSSNLTVPTWYRTLRTYVSTGYLQGGRREESLVVPKGISTLLYPAEHPHTITLRYQKTKPVQFYV
jgi:hypothetical protein